MNGQARQQKTGNGKIAIIWLLLIAVSTSPALAYDVIDVPHGGSIEGVVRLDGVVPETKGFNLITFPDPVYCGRISNGRGWRLLRDFVVSPDA